MPRSPGISLAVDIQNTCNNKGEHISGHWTVVTKIRQTLLFESVMFAGDKLSREFPQQSSKTFDSFTSRELTVLFKHIHN